MRKPSYFLALLISAFLSHAKANDENIFYVGTGTSKAGSQSISNTAPVTLGYVRQSKATATVWGVDISGEGSVPNSTWGQRIDPSSGNNALKKPTSFNFFTTSINFMVGKAIGESQVSRFDVALIAGVREKSTDCQATSLGYQCLANSSPNTTRELNYGAVVTWTYQKIMFGARATGESNQLLIGIRF